MAFSLGRKMGERQAFFSEYRLANRKRVEVLIRYGYIKRNLC